MPKTSIQAHKFNINQNDINHDALYVIEKLQHHGFDGYIVGGGIRDLLLGKRPKDFDIVTNAKPEEVQHIFKRNSIIIGRRFKIVHVVFNNINPEKFVNNRPINERHVLEVSTYRSLKVHKQSVSEHGKVLFDNIYGTQKEDANRRDFTINAIFYDPIKEVLIDYHNGIQDITDKKLHMIGTPEERFKEDPVRIIRAIRLATKLDLKISPHLVHACKTMADFLLNENKSRLYEEMIKILLSGHGCACIQRIHKLPFPSGVFPLFDQLFFGKQIDKFAWSIVEKTDLRLLETTDVSIVFILAGLLWSIVNKNWQELNAQNISNHDALNEAILNSKNFALSVGINKNTFNYMQDVWMLQFDLDNPNSSRIRHTLNSSRFRQAWHLFSLRHEFKQVPATTFKWWNDYIEADDITQKKILHTLKASQRKNKKPLRTKAFTA